VPAHGTMMTPRAPLFNVLARPRGRP